MRKFLRSASAACYYNAPSTISISRRHQKSVALSRKQATGAKEQHTPSTSTSSSAESGGNVAAIHKQSNVVRSTRPNYEMLSDNDLHGELLRHGKTTRDGQHVANVTFEILKRIGMSNRIPLRLVREATYMCHSTAEYDLCLEVFFERKRREAGSTAMEKMPVFDVVVDAAFAKKSGTALEEVAAESVAAVRSWGSDVSEVSLFRCFWRAVMLSEERVALDRRQGPKTSTANNVEPTRYNEYEATAKKIFELLKQVNSNMAQLDLAFEDLYRKTAFFVMYGRAKDHGELRFYDHIFTTYLFPANPNASESAQSSSSTQQPISPSTTNAFLKSCCSGGIRSDMLEFYFKRYVSSLNNTSLSTDNADDDGITSGSTAGGSVNEALLHTYLSLLLEAKQHKKILSTMDQLTDLQLVDGSRRKFQFSGRRGENEDIHSPNIGANDNVETPHRMSGVSSSVLAIVARAAGELRDRPTAIACLNQSLSGQGNGDGVDTAAANVQPPTSFEVFVMLQAIAKCGTPTFRDILSSCVENKVFKVTEEELLFLMLQYASCSTDPVENTNAVLDELAKEKRSALLASHRIQTLLLTTHSKHHTAEFLGLYDECVALQKATHGALFKQTDQTTTTKRRFVDYLLSYSQRVRYQLTVEHRKELLQRIRALGFWTPADLGTAFGTIGNNELHAQYGALLNDQKRLESMASEQPNTTSSSVAYSTEGSRDVLLEKVLKGSNNSKRLLLNSVQPSSCVVYDNDGSEVGDSAIGCVETADAVGLVCWPEGPAENSNTNSGGVSSPLDTLYTHLTVKHVRNMQLRDGTAAESL